MEDKVATFQTTGQLLAPTREVKQKIQNLVLQRDESILLEALPPRCKEIVFLSMTQQQADTYAALVEQAGEERQNANATASRLAVVLQNCKEGFIQPWIAHGVRTGVKSVVVASRMAMLDMITWKCQRMGLQWRRLDGSMTAAARDIAVQDFRARGVRDPENETFHY